VAYFVAPWAAWSSLSRRLLPPNTTALDIGAGGRVLAAGPGFVYWSNIFRGEEDVVRIPALNAISHIVAIGEQLFVLSDSTGNLKLLKVSKYSGSTELTDMEPLAKPGAFLGGDLNCLFASRVALSGVYGKHSLTTVERALSRPAECVSLAGTLPNCLPKGTTILGHSSQDGKWVAYNRSRACLYLVSHPHKIDHRLSAPRCLSASWAADFVDLLEPGGTVSRWLLSGNGQLSLIFKAKSPYADNTVSVHSVSNCMVFVDLKRTWYEVVRVC
jgi:hypothetical protein